MHSHSVTATKLPDQSALWPRVTKGDFLDCYSVPATTPVRVAADIITTFPAWARGLLKIRRALTAPFGLDNDGPDSPNRVGIFPIETETKTELIAGFNDRHLNFRVSVIADDSRIFLATWVHPHNFGGRAYLALIYPFHVMIVRNALARVAKSTAKHGSVSV